MLAIDCEVEVEAEASLKNLAPARLFTRSSGTWLCSDVDDGKVSIANYCASYRYASREKPTKRGLICSACRFDNWPPKLLIACVSTVSLHGYCGKRKAIM